MLEPLQNTVDSHNIRVEGALQRIFYRGNIYGWYLCYAAFYVKVVSFRVVVNVKQLCRRAKATKL